MPYGNMHFVLLITHYLRAVNFSSLTDKYSAIAIQDSSLVQHTYLAAELVLRLLLSNQFDD